MFQIEVIKIEVLRGTEQEVKCWDEVLAFRRDVLSKPWSVSAEEEEKCKRDMEKALRKAKSSKSHKADARTKKGDEVAKVGRGDESRVNRKDGEGEEESSRRHEGKKRRRDKEEGLDPTNKVNHPSMAVRRRVAGKYDALGI
jgi:endo-1,3(4)-beta-glucanase